MATLTKQVDETALRGLMDQYAILWNKVDVKGLSSLFADDAEFISSLGIRCRGRKAIEEFYAGNLVKGPFKGTNISCTIDDVRPLGEDVGIVRGLWKMTTSGKPLRDGYVNAVAIHQNGRWVFHTFQATALEGTGTARAAA